MKTRFYIFLIFGTLLMLVQIVLLIFISQTKYVLIDPSKDGAYITGTLLFFFCWSAAGIPLLIGAHRINKKIARRKFEHDNFLDYNDTPKT